MIFCELEGIEMLKEYIQEVGYVENFGSVKFYRDDNGFIVEWYFVIIIFRNKYIFKNFVIMWFIWYVYIILNFECFMFFKVYIIWIKQYIDQIVCMFKFIFCILF